MNWQSAFARTLIYEIEDASASNDESVSRGTAIEIADRLIKAGYIKPDDESATDSL